MEVVDAQPVAPLRLRRSAGLLGGAVTDSEGIAVGVIEDVLIDPATGQVIGVAATLRQVEGDDLTTVAEYGTVVWGSDSPPTPTLILGGTQGGFAQHAGLFEGQDPLKVAGKVTAIEVQSGAACSAVALKLLDQENLLHRVLVEPALLIRRCFPPLEVGQSLEVEGVLTRDASGKLLIASTIVQNGERLELRASSGELQWEALTARLISGKGLAGQTVTAVDSSALEIRGWLLDWAGGLATHVALDVDGIERAIPWAQLVRAGGSDAWSVEMDRAGLSSLPVVSQDGQVAEGL